MSKLGNWIAAVGLPLLLGSTPVVAEDIDLYTGGLGPGNEPTVLWVWDNAARNSASANNTVCAQYADAGEYGADADMKYKVPSLGTNTSAGMEQCAMVNALLAMRNNERLLDKVRIGLMIFNKNGFANNGNGQCGYLVHAPQLMSRDGINELILKIKNFNNNTKADGVAVGTTMAEAWAALNGKSNSCSGVDYSHLAETAAQCRDGVLIYIGNAFTNSSAVDGGNTAANAETILKSELTNAFGYAAGSDKYSLYTQPIPVALLNTSGNRNNSFWADEWARFMRHVPVIDSTQGDHNITTYTIAVTDEANQAQAQPLINYYAEMAKQGGGKGFKLDFHNTQGLSDILLSILNDTRANNSVFAAATLPVTANTQGTYLNQVFIAMFRPDGNAQPRWYGNLKQYQLGLNNGEIVLTDSTENPDAGDVTSKTNRQTGAISSDAVSFWTTNSPSPAVAGWPANGFWINSLGGGHQYDAPDGENVEKGGAAQMSRVDNLTATYADSNNDNGRKLLTCNAEGSCGTLTEFATSNATLMANAPSRLGAGQGTSYSGTLSVGDRFTARSEVKCNTDQSRICSFTVPTDYYELQSGDTIVNTLTGNLEAKCSMPAGCSVDSTYSDTFTYSISELATSSWYTVPSGTPFYKAKRSVTVSTSTAHGLNVGDSVILKNCSGQADSSLVTGLSNLPGNGSNKAVIVTGVADSATFTFDWTRTGLTLDGANVSCTIEPALTASNLINWVRGWDISGNEALVGPGGAVTVRPSLHGDVLHSRPAVVNYGGSTGVVVFYGANDGVFRAINGNQNASIGSVRPGGELWSFIAPEFHGKLKRLFNNAPLLDIPGVVADQKLPKDYFFDGSPSILRDTRTGQTEKTYIYMTARRGGRLIYAFDVTNPTDPRYLWSKDESDIPELGQTWSQPKVALVHGHANPVLIMGAGYAPEQDADPVAAANDSMGRGVVVLDALNGSVVWAALADCSGLSGSVCTQVPELTRSIAADVTLLDRNSDGYIDRIYAADTGANIWRIDLEPRGYALADNTPSDWNITKLAALGGSGNDARKFLYAPDVIPTSDFDAIMAVSGDREHPLYTSASTAGLAYNVQNRIYMIKDMATGSAIDPGFIALTHGDLVDMSAQLDPAVAVKPTFDSTVSTVKGFYIDLPNQGEKGVNAPLTVAGKTYFGTNYPDVPNDSACTADLGFARAYTVDFKTAKVFSTAFVGGGLPPSPVSGLVNIGDETKPFIIGGSGPTTFDPSIPEIELNKDRKRAYWYAK